MVNAAMSTEGRHAAVDDSPAGIAKASVALIGRALVASLGCGLVAGLASSVPCFARAVPLIKDAEAYEGDDGLCADGNSMDPACQDDGAWAPSEGARDWCTLVSNCWIGVAYAAIALSLALARASPLDASAGLQLGLVGFLAFQVMPALGLSPELPGMLAANEYARQSWWALCALCTLAGAWLGLAAPPRQLLLKLAGGQSWWAEGGARAVAGGLGVLLAVAPNLAGAPHPDDDALVMGSAVPAELAAEFAVASELTTFVFWLALGASVGAAAPVVDPAGCALFDPAAASALTAAGKSSSASSSSSSSSSPARGADADGEAGAFVEGGGSTVELMPTSTVQI